MIYAYRDASGKTACISTCPDLRGYASRSVATAADVAAMDADREPMPPTLEDRIAELEKRLARLEERDARA